MLKLLETLKDSAESAFDSAALRVENVHRLIGGYVGERTRRRPGRKNPPLEADESADASKSSIYDVIRGVNREVGEFGTDLFEIIDDARARRRAEKHTPRDDESRDDE